MERVDFETREESEFSIPDHDGIPYMRALDVIHKIFKPATYLEVGTSKGGSLAQSTCQSIAIDPIFRLGANFLGKKQICMLFQMSSDDFFDTYSAVNLFGQAVDLAFLDGMHLFEFLLRDFYNTEAVSSQNSLIVMHDCLPTEKHYARRDFRDRSLRSFSKHPGWWAGDVWKTLLILRELRSDLNIYCLNARPTGLVIISGLNPDSKELRQQYDSIVRKYSSVDIRDISLSTLYQELPLIACNTIEQAEDAIVEICSKLNRPETAEAPVRRVDARAEA